MSEKKSSEKICVGKIVAAHGIRGEVKLHSYTENPVDLLKYSPITNLTGDKVYKFKKRSVNDKILIVQLEGVVDRNAAELLRNIELYIERSALPKIREKNIFYAEDLKALKVICKDTKEEYGKVIDVLNYGASDIVNILKKNGKEEMFSFTLGTFPEVNVEEGYIVIDVPEIIE